VTPCSLHSLSGRLAPIWGGNPYLSWAFTEAAHFAIRFEPLAKRFYERKKARTNELVALRTISHKLARASFYILQDRVPFRSGRAFG
jgi:transposase